METFGILLVAVAFLFTGGSAGKATAVPKLIDEGITPKLTVTCTFPPSSTEMSSVVSIKLSIQTDLTSTKETELAVITAFQPSTAKGINLSGAVASGLINKTGESTISVTWTNPSSAQVGIYLCTLNGLDDLGHPVVLSATTRVDIGEPDVERLLGEMLAIKNSMLAFQQQLQEKTTQTSQLQNLVQTLNFRVSPVYKDRRYYYPKHKVSDLQTALSECQALGGYLAEIDDADEWVFVKSSFLVLHYNASVNTAHALLGAVETVQDSHWTFIRTGLPVTFLDWYPGQPNHHTDGIKDCMIMYFYKSKLGMADDPCALADTLTYICEVPTV